MHCGILSSRLMQWTHPVHGNNCPLPVFALESLGVKLSGDNTITQYMLLHFIHTVMS